MPRILHLFVLLFLVVSMVDTASAHRPGESYVFFQHPEPGVLTGRFEVYGRDIDKQLPVDANGDGEITTEELRPHFDAIGAMMGETLKVTIEGVTHVPVIGRVGVRKGSDIVMVKFQLPNVTSVPDIIQVDYRFLWDGPLPNHTAFGVIEENHRTGAKHLEANIVASFGPGAEVQDVDFRIPPRLQVVWTFIKHGIWHIWIGLDHILFIIALLLPAVLERRDGQWSPVADFKTALRALLRVVTMFTLAHSVTLSLAAMNLFTLPSRLVEGTIALSIGVMAMNNIRPVYNDRSWMAIFGFGLFHGLGFASVMKPLGLQPAVMLSSLVGFNVGVEIGQVAIVAVVFPILYLLRNTSVYVKGVLVGGSAVLVVVSLYWFAERLVIPGVLSLL